MVAIWSLPASTVLKSPEATAELDTAAEPELTTDFSVPAAPAEAASTEDDASAEDAAEEAAEEAEDEALPPHAASPAVIRTVRASANFFFILNSFFPINVTFCRIFPALLQIEILRT